MKSKLFKCLIAIMLMMPFGLIAQSSTTTKTTTTKKATTAKKPVKKKTTSTASKTTKPAAPAAAAEKMPVMTFASKFTNFGKVKTGDMPTMTYEFTNTGNMPLDIEICTGCECTEIDWTRTTVQPGEKGFVKAVFNTVKAEKEDHKKQLTKYVDIILKQSHPKSGYPLVESVKFDVFIVD